MLIHRRSRRERDVIEVEEEISETETCSIVVVANLDIAAPPAQVNRKLR